jgi:protein-disulfide isomerase
VRIWAPDRRRFIEALGAGALLAGTLAACKEKPKAAEEKGLGQGKLPERADDIALGPADAPVQVIEYASMTCHFCASFAVGDAALGQPAVFPQIKAKYIETGKVHYIMREFPADGFALAASMAMRCAVGRNPERYYAAIDLVFQRQKDWAFSSQDGVTIKNNLAEVMNEIGLGRAKFDACVADEKGLQRIKEVQNQAVDKFDVGGVPTFIINGAKYEGTLEFDRFEEIVAPLLQGS